MDNELKKIKDKLDYLALSKKEFKIVITRQGKSLEWEYKIVRKSLLTDEFDESMIK